MGVTQQITAAVIGCSDFAVRHMEGYAENPGSRLVAVVDLNADLAAGRGRQFGVSSYSSLHNMLDEARPQACTIFTPPATHKQIAEELARRGIAILCEKPLAVTPAEAGEIVGMAERAGVVLLVGFCYRFCELVLKARSLVESGAIGRMALCTIRFGSKFPYEGTWRVHRECGGGFMMDSLIHFLDLFRWFFGEVDRVYGVLRAINPTMEADDVASVMLSAESSQSGVLEGSWVTPSLESRISLDGDEGSLVLSYAKVRPNQLTFRKGQREEVLFSSNSARFKAEIDHFLACIRGETKPLVTGADGVKALEIAEAIYRSVREQRAVKVGRTEKTSTHGVKEDRPGS